MASLLDPGTPNAVALAATTNAPPVAADARFTLSEDGLLSAGLPQANDADGDPVTYALIGPASAGQVQIAASGALVYTPRPEFNGSDSFVYEVTDGRGGRNEYTVQLSVTAVNDAPRLQRSFDKAGTNAGAQTTLTLPVDSFIDIDGDTLVYAAARADGTPLPSWLVFDALTRTFTARPGAADGGAVSVRVTASDGSASANGTFDWSVTALPPRAVGGVVADGYVGGSRIFLDSNDNGLPELTEFTGLVTDASGRFNGTVYGEGRLIAYGGVDAFHGAPNNMLLSAPAGGTLLNPLTTLLDSMIARQGLTAAAAQTAVRSAFGLPATLDLLRYDPLAQAAGDATALQVQRVAVQLALFAALMEDTATAMALVGGKVADGQPLDLSSSSVVRSLFARLESDPRLVSTIADATARTVSATTIDGLMLLQGDSAPRFQEWKPTLDTPLALARAVLAGDSGIRIDADSVRVQFGSGTDAIALQPNTSVGFYLGGIEGLQIGAGAILSTGDATPATRNAAGSIGVTLGQYSDGPPLQDGDLLAVVREAFPRVSRVVDTSVLEFAFTVTDPQARYVEVELVFGSEEFSEPLDGDFVDVAAVWVNGRNAALFDGRASQPLTVSSRNEGTGAFRDNLTGSVRIEYDAISHRLLVSAPIVSGRNTIKFAVGDGVDGSNDSALLVAGLRAVREGAPGMRRVIDGTAVDDVIVGAEAGELMRGGPGADVLRGLGGDDWIDGGPGDDLIDGGAGVDIARYAATFAAVTVRRSGERWSVASAVDGEDQLTGVERLVLADRAVALDLDGAAGTVARLLGVLFGKGAVNDPIYAGIGIGLLDAGKGKLELAALAVGTPEFASLSGGRSNAQFVDWVYRNVVGAAPSAAEAAPFVAMLDRGEQTQASLALLAAETALAAQQIDLVGLAAKGLPYEPFYP